ncbi:hypothetical protein D3C75_1151140 [compost metagenome]
MNSTASGSPNPTNATRRRIFPSRDISISSEFWLVTVNRLLRTGSKVSAETSSSSPSITFASITT